VAHAGGNLFSRARNQARSAEVIVGFSRFGGKYFVVFARKDSDLTLVGPFKPYCLLVVNQKSGEAIARDVRPRAA